MIFLQDASIIFMYVTSYSNKYFFVEGVEKTAVIEQGKYVKDIGCRGNITR